LLSSKLSKGNVKHILFQQCSSCLWCYVYAFCLRTSKDSSVGEFNESIISIFNIIFESVLFIFDFVLFNIISFLVLFYFNCKLFNFRNKYYKDWALEQKKRIWSWLGLKIRRFSTKIWRPQVRSVARPMPPATWPCQLPWYLLLLFASWKSYY